LTVLDVSTIVQALGALRTLCNGTGMPDFSKLQIGDYLDGIDLSALPAENDGTAGQAWNDAYKNNRIALSAFNPYKKVGDTETTKNHLRFDFVNAPLRKRMNPTNDNAGGYPATEICAFLDGSNGNGTEDKAGVTTAAFLYALKAQLGDYILPVRLLLSNKAGWAWITRSLWLPSENDIFGTNVCGGGESNYGDGQKLHIPLYRDSYTYRIKRYNGSRDWWWLNTPSSGSAVFFCAGSRCGAGDSLSASAVGGCAPDSVRRDSVDRSRSTRPTQKEKTSRCNASRLYTNIRLDTSGRTLLAWRVACVKPVPCPPTLCGVLRSASLKRGTPYKASFIFIILEDRRID
jgi:hypothetical protein